MAQEPGSPGCAEVALLVGNGDWNGAARFCVTRLDPNPL